MRVLLVWNGPADIREGIPLIRRQVPLLSSLRSQGVAPIVALLGDSGRLRQALHHAGTHVELLPTNLPPGAASLWRLPSAVLALRRLIRKHAPDVVEGDEPMPAIATGIAAKGLPPVVVYRRHHGGGRWRLHVASRVAARVASRTLVSSELMRQQTAIDDRISVDRIDVTPSGAMCTEAPTVGQVDAVRTALGIDGKARVIVCVARLRHEKGLDLLIGALPLLVDLAPLHLVIVGVGPEEDALRALAAAAPLPVHFAGFRNDVSTFLALGDVVAMPSRREMFGRVTLEAMAGGKPIVAGRVGGLPVPLGDDCGVLVEPNDPRALAAGLRELLEHPERACVIGRNARARFEARYTIDHMATAWRQGWERALNASRVS